MKKLHAKVSLTDSEIAALIIVIGSIKRSDHEELFSLCQLYGLDHELMENYTVHRLADIYKKLMVLDDAIRLVSIEDVEDEGQDDA